MTVSAFLTIAGDMVGLVTEGLSIFMEPPVVWFVGLGALAIGIGMARSLIPTRK